MLHLRFNEEALTRLKPTIERMVGEIVNVLHAEYSIACQTAEIEDDEGVLYTLVLSSLGIVLAATAEVADEAMATARSCPRGTITPETVALMVRKYFDQRESGEPASNIRRIPRELN